MDMFKMIQRMTDIENEEKTKQLNESAIAECGEAAMPAPMDQGNPVTMSVTLNASGKEHVNDLMAMMKAAGLDNAKPMAPDMMPMRQDMDRLGAIMRNAEMGEEDLEEYDNEPEETYMSQPKGGGINREKHAYLDAEDGDNAIAVESDDEDEMRESIKSKLLKSLEEKKAKPDFLDMDKDGDKKEPMKKAIKDKGSKPKKGKVPPQFQKKTNEAESRSLANLPREDVKKAYQIYAKQMKQGSLGAEAEDLVAHFAITKLGYSEKDADTLAQRAAIMHIDAVGEAEVQAPSHEMSDVARKAASMAQVIKRKINSGDEMDDRDYNQMAELGAVLSRVGTNFGPKSMKDVLAHMIDYTDARNQEGHGYPEMNVDRFKELLAMAKSTGESMMGEISSDLAKRYTKAAKMDRDFNDDDIKRLSKSGQSTQAMHRRNSKRTKGINRAAKRIEN